MSNVDLLAFLSTVAEQAAGMAEQPEAAPLGHWENFDMDLAMAVLEGEANGTPAIPEPVLTTDTTQLPLPGSDCHPCHIPVPTRCKQESWQPNVYDRSQDQEPVPSPPSCSHTPHLVEITPRYSPSSHVQEHSPNYTQLDSFQYSPEYVNQPQPSPDYSNYDQTQLSPHYSEYSHQSQSSPEYTPFEEKQECGGRPDDARRLRRREQNRMAARRCRERKKMARSNLVKEYYELVSANAELTSRIERLEVERQHLNKTLHTHVVNCGLQPNL